MTYLHGVRDRLLFQKSRMSPFRTTHVGNARNPLSVSQPCAKKTPREAGCESEADGTRTRNHRIDSPVHQSRKPTDSKGLRTDAEPRATHSATLSVKSAPSDPDLSAVIDAWPTLPKAIRAGIVAMVRASKG